jgi:citrate lyase beta subunit
LDLEDSVAASEKERALDNVVEALKSVILDVWRVVDGGRRANILRQRWQFELTSIS